MALDVFLQLYCKSRLIPGESQDPTFKKAMEITDFSLDTEANLKKSVRAFEASTGKAGFMKRQQTLLEKMGKDKDARGERMTVKGYESWLDDVDTEEENESVNNLYLNVTKLADSASPYLFLNYCQVAADQAEENKFEKAVIYIRKPGGEGFVFVKLEFTDVYVVNYSVSLSDANTNTPVETVKFCCAAYTMEYIAQSASGTADPSSRRQLGWSFREKKRL